MAIPKYQDILRLHLKEVKKSKIAEITGNSRTTIIAAINAFKQLNLSLDEINSMSDIQLKMVLYPKAPAEKENLPDVQKIERELGHKHVTLKLLWKEYLVDCAEKKVAPLMYSRFCYYYQQHANTRKVTGHVERVSGFSCEVDWCGTTMEWLDLRTNEVHKAWLFVGCLSYSRYTFCQAFNSQDIVSWITAHNNMFRFFGGSTQIIICDNLKTGVIKNVKGETRINRTYLEIARHYGTVISPAAVKHAKGKPNVEDTAGIIGNHIIAVLRHVVFYSLTELNQAIRNKIEQINENPFQKREGSRKILLEQVECNDLQQLPATPFELADWHTGLKVQYNYHIKVDKWFYYSVPHQYVTRTVSVRVTLSVVEIFLDNLRIATHTRNYDRRRSYCTETAHMPTEQQEAKEKWNERRFLSWAKSIGENTRTVITDIINSRQVIQQAYPTCMALLNLSKKYGENLLEQACTQVVKESFSPSFTNVKNILATMSASELTEQSSLSSAKPRGFLREPSYFEEVIKREGTHDQK